MKKCIAVFLMIALSVSTAFAKESNPIKEAKKKLRTEIVKLLGNNDFKLEEGIAKAEISILVNNKGELVVVSVKSKNEEIENYVKGKLNYKKVSVTALEKMKIYIMPLKIVKN